MNREQVYPEEDFAIRSARERLVDQLRVRGIKDVRILKAMNRIPRHRFIPVEYIPLECDWLEYTYGDFPCPIGYGQTISQPYIVAYMTELIEIQEGDRVLEIGSGSGYQTAVLLSLGVEVYSIEIAPELMAFAASKLIEMGFENFHLKEGDGYQGWMEFTPYQAIVVTCAPEEVPPNLVKQLDEGGRMVLPLGKTDQHLVLILKRGKRVTEIEDLSVRFVPMIHSN